MRLENIDFNAIALTSYAKEFLAAMAIYKEAKIKRQDSPSKYRTVVMLSHLSSTLESPNCVWFSFGLLIWNFKLMKH